jgi:hypothetical protein
MSEPNSPEGTVHSFRSGRKLSPDETRRHARWQERKKRETKSPNNRRPLSHKIVEKAVSYPGALKKAAIGTVAVATAALGVHEIGQAFDANQKLGKYAPDKTTTTVEQVVATQAEDVKENKIFNGTLGVTIKTEDGVKLAVRFKPDIPEKSKLETTEVDWNNIMALKPDNKSPETYIHNMNSFQISGRFKLVDGFDPVSKNPTGGSWFRLIAVMKDGTEQNVFLSRSEFTKNHINTKGLLSDPNGDNSVPINLVNP